VQACLPSYTLSRSAGAPPALVAEAEAKGEQEKCWLDPALEKVLKRNVGANLFKKMLV
jgi:hypothetical protein